MPGKLDTQNVSDIVLLIVSIFFIPDESNLYFMLCWFCNLKSEAIRVLYFQDSIDGTTFWRSGI